MEGYSGVSQEELIIAMKYLAENGAQNNISALQYVEKEDLEKFDKIDQEMYQRINESIERENSYDFMILAWTNYWNITMEREYGRDNCAPVKAEVVKAMLVVESNMGADNTAGNYILNPERDIKQTLDCRNPVVWAVINDNGNGKTIRIVYAQEDVNKFALNPSQEYGLSMSDSGAGAKSYYGNGTWKVVSELFSPEHDIYYAGNVTPEISLAVGIAEYCRQLNGSGTNGGNSILKNERSAVEGYNGGGDDNYIYKINLVLDNMGVNRLEEP